MALNLPRLPAFRNISAQLKGRVGEGIALMYFLSRGYIPFRRPWQTLAQTDLLLKKKDVLVLVEVKVRSCRSRGHLALHPAQKSRLHRQLAAIVAKYPEYTVRLDLFLVFPQWPWVEHLPALDLPQAPAYHGPR